MTWAEAAMPSRDKNALIALAVQAAPMFLAFADFWTDQAILDRRGRIIFVILATWLLVLGAWLRWMIRCKELPSTPARLGAAFAPSVLLPLAMIFWCPVFLWINHARRALGSNFFEWPWFDALFIVPYLIAIRVAVQKEQTFDVAGNTLFLFCGFSFVLQPHLFRL